MKYKQHLDLALAAVLLVAVLWAFRPGFMSPDSIDQFSQAIANSYSDFHPPVMAWVWHFINKIHFGPFGMMGYHCGLFFVGLALLARCLTEKTRSRCDIILLFCVMPAVFTQFGAIWKDVGMSFSYLLACALALYARRDPRAWVLAIPVLFYGTAVRHNALAALLPLAAWMGWIYGGERLSRKTVFAGALLFGGLVSGAWGLNNWLAGGQKAYLSQSVQMHDLAAISLSRESLQLPRTPTFETITLERLKQLYRPHTSLYIIDNLPKTHDRSEKEALNRFWLNTIAHWPGAYLKHRWGIYRTFLGIGTKHVMLPYIHRNSMNPWGFQANNTIASYWVYYALMSLRDSFLFRGYVYVGLNLFCFLFALRRRHVDAVAVSGSGLLYAASFFPSLPGPDFRYLYWTILAGFISLMMLIFTPSAAKEKIS